MKKEQVETNRKKTLEDIRARRKRYLRERKAAGECTAVICHGPGHQSRTFCHNTKKGHRVHEAYYGSYDQYARWTGQEVCSGFFDEPPQY